MLLLVLFIRILYLLLKKQKGFERSFVSINFTYFSLETNRCLHMVLAADVQGVSGFKVQDPKFAFDVLTNVTEITVSQDRVDATG